VFTYEVMRELAKRGHEMTLFTTQFSDGMEENTNLSCKNVL
jgi:hypothetical protein